MNGRRLTGALLAAGIVTALAACGWAVEPRAESYAILMDGGLWGWANAPDQAEAERFWGFIKEAGFEGHWQIMSWKLPQALAEGATDQWSKFWMRAGKAGVKVWPEIQAFGRLMPDGKRLRGGWWVAPDGREIYSRMNHVSCYSDPAHLRASIQACTDFARSLARPDSAFYKWNGRYWISIIDEPHWANPSDNLNFTCYCQYCQESFRRYLRDVAYEDDSPAADSNGDRHTLNSDAGTHFSSWDQVRIPVPAERESRPYLWYHFMNFRPWALAQYRLKVKAVLNKFNVGMASQFFGMAEHPNYGVRLGVKHEDYYPTFDLLEIEHTGADHPIPKLDFYRWEYLNRKERKPMHRWMHIYQNLGGHAAEPYYIRGQRDKQVRRISRTYARTLMHDFQSISLFAFGKQNDPYPNYPEMWREIAYWNFFIKAHQDYLLTSELAAPQVAVLFPWTAAMFYDSWQGPQKYDYEWGGQALMAGNWPVTPLGEDLVAKEDALSDFKLLYLFSIDRVPWRVADAIRRFHRAGGWIWADSNSLTRSVARKDTRLFQDIFHAAPDETGNGPATIVMTTNDILPRGTTLKTFGKVTTVSPGAECEVLATWEGKPVMVRAERAVFLGTELGKDIFCLCPPFYVQGGEPVDQFNTNRLRKDSMVELAPYVGLATATARWAGIERPVVVRREGHTALNIEARVRIQDDTGVRMLILSNHEPCVDGFYDVTVAGVKGGIAWDLLHGELIEKPTDGSFKVHVPSWGVAVVLVGPEEAVRKMAGDQAQKVDGRPLPQVYGFQRWLRTGHAR